LRREILNAIFTTINSKGRNGAPPQSVRKVASEQHTETGFPKAKEKAWPKIRMSESPVVH
jgi:hypothetical protein